jgi:predicted phage tail protein
MRVIKVYGSLAKFLGQRSFRAAVSTPAEAMRFLVANFPGLREHMAEKYYKVGVGKIDLNIGDQPEQLHYPTGKAEAIRIVPVIGGAKNAGLGQVLVGIALITLAIVTGGIASAGVALGGLMGIGTIGTAVVGIGASLVLGGVAQMLTPVPKTSFDESNPSKSYNFSGIQNVSRQGVPVPICYGEVLVGSVVISAGINAEDI